MIVSDHQDGKIVILSKAFDTRAKILNFIYFTVFAFAGLALGSTIFLDINFGFGLFLLWATAVSVCLYAGYKFINKSLQSEKMLVNKTNLTIIKTGFLNEKKKQLSNCRYF